MKKIQKLIVITGLFIFNLLGATTNVHAQLTDPGCDPLGGVYPNGTPCPIDGGVASLLVLGAAYGAKKVIDRHKAASTAQ